MKSLNLGKFDCSTGLINVLYDDKVKTYQLEQVL